MKRIVEFAAAIIGLHLSGRRVPGMGSLGFGQLTDSVWTKRDLVRCECDGSYRGLVTDYFDRPNQFKRSEEFSQMAESPT